jgi:GTP-binding protein
MFTDRAKIYVRSGKGGDGHVSFRREMYVANGGPDGGDGGKGGDVVFVVAKGLNTLSEFRHHRKFIAEDGGVGGRRRQHGADGENVIIEVPQGTVIREETTGKVIVDMADPDMRFVIVKGGKGGKGNQHYATPTMQIPKFAQPGQDSRDFHLLLELKTIADVGLIGFPNVGKSTFLASVTNARPKVANYHFTTLNPNLGVVDLEDGQGFVIADIPGLIEGASEGIGLGHEFLRHIERTRVNIHIVDVAGVEGRDPVDDINIINNELKVYNNELSSRPQVIAANKIDLGDYSDNIQALRDEFEPKGIKVYPISAVTGKGVRELLFHVKDLLKSLNIEPIIFEREYFEDEKSVVSNEPYTVEKVEDNVYAVEGPRIQRMLGYTNLESEKGFDFFQKFLRENNIIDELKELGIQEGDIVRMYYLEFEYFE